MFYFLFEDNGRFGLPRWLRGKESTCNAGASVEVGLIPESRRSPGGGNGNPLQYACLENPRNSRAWRATVHGVSKNRVRLKQLSMHAMVDLLAVLRNNTERSHPYTLHPVFPSGNSLPNHSTTLQSGSWH